MLSEKFQADIPLQMFVFPARDRARRSPRVFTKYAAVPRRPAHAPAGRDRRAAATTGSSSGPTPCCGDRGRDRARGALASRSLVAVPVVFLGVFFVWPVVAILGAASRPTARSTSTRSATSSPTRRSATSPGSPSGRPSLSTVLTLAARAPRRVRPQPLPVPRPRRSCARSSPSRSCSRRSSSAPRSARSGSPARVGAILLAHVFFNYAVVVRTVGGLWSHLDPRPEEAAQMLGASRWRTFVSVTLPALRPAIVAAASIVFLFCFTSFGVILVLGGPQLRHARDRDLPPDRAAPRPPGRRRARDRPARRGARRARASAAGPGAGAPTRSASAPRARRAPARAAPAPARSSPRTSRSWPCSSARRSPCS